MAVSFKIKYTFQYSRTSLVAQMENSPPAMWETWVRSLGQENPLGKGMAAHSSILAWRIPRTEVPGGLQSMGSQRVRHDWATQHSTAHVYPMTQWYHFYKERKYMSIKKQFYFFTVQILYTTQIFN